MSWHFSQALVAAYSAEHYWDGELFAQWKSMPFAPDDSCSDKMKDTSHRSLFGTMFVPLTDTHGEDLLTWFLGDFLARTSVRQTPTQRELTESEVDYGVICLESGVRFAPDIGSWKTHQCLWEEDLPESSVILPQWGIMQDGVVFTLQTLVRRTQGNAYSLLLPTPTATANQHFPSMMKWPSSVRWMRFLYHLMQGRHFPTQTCSDAKGASAKRFFQSPEYKGNLREFLRDGISDGQYPNPALYEWMMGWPRGWTEHEPLGTDKFRMWLDSHGGR